MDLMDYAHLSTPTYNITSEQALLDLCHSINGRQLNLLEAEGDKQYKESVNSFREVTEMARNDLQHMLESWCHVEGRAWPAEDTAAGLWVKSGMGRKSHSWPLYGAAGTEGGSC